MTLYAPDDRRRRRRRFATGRGGLLLLAGLSMVAVAHAGEVRVAVAANFIATMRALSQDFEALSSTAFQPIRQSRST